MFLDRLSKIKINNNGTVLILSLIILSILLTIGMIISGVVIRDIATNRGTHNSDSAYYAASAGISKALWLINNNIYSNDDAVFLGYQQWSYYIDSKINMCPDFLKKKNSDCSCPVTPYDNKCISDNEGDLIVSGKIDESNSDYNVYININYDTDGNRILRLTSIGKSGEFKRALENNICLGVNCK